MNKYGPFEVTETDEFWSDISGEPTPQMVANFLWRVIQYIKDRRPFEMATIAILNEKCYDIMDAYLGPEKAKRIA